MHLLQFVKKEPFVRCYKMQTTQNNFLNLICKCIFLNSKFWGFFKIIIKYKYNIHNSLFDTPLLTLSTFKGIY